MKVRKFSFLLFIFTIIGGIIGAITGEWMVSELRGEFPNSILVGLYFGQLGLWMGVMAFIAEKWKPQLLGKRWSERYALFSLKLLFPVMFLLPFAVGAILQFIYELDALDAKPPEDIVLLLDVSESMLDTDPDKKTVTTVKNFLMNINKDQRSAIFVFNNETTLLQPYMDLTTDREREEAGKEFERTVTYSGGTDIALSLRKAMDYINEDNEDRRTMVILLSDGNSEMNIEESLEPYQRREMVINTVGLSKEIYEGAELLSAISEGTGGNYYSVNDTKQLSNALDEIQRDTQDRLLIGERQGITEYQLLYKLLRVLFISFIGAILGLALGLMFDNRFLAQSFAWGGLVAGLLAGCILEWGFSGFYESGFGIRLWSDIVLAVIISVFSAVVPYRKYVADSGTGRPQAFHDRKKSPEDRVGKSSKTFY